MRRTAGIACSAALGSVLGLVPALAGELDTRTIRRSAEWEPSGCYQPNTPSFFISDVDDFNYAVQEYNDWLAEVEDYMECVQSEAENDLSTFRAIIEDSVSNVGSELQNEIDVVRSGLELQRP